jgi:hypothetical protein
MRSLGKNLSKRKKGGLVNIILIIIAVIVLVVFIYGMIDLSKEKKSSEGNASNITSFWDFLKDIFKKSGVKDSAQKTEESLKHLKVTTCSLDTGLKCLPVKTEGNEVVFVVSNNIPKLYYDLHNVKISIETGICDGNLSGSDDLKSGDIRNYTITNCTFENFLSGNISFHALSKEKINYDARGTFFLKKI